MAVSLSLRARIFLLLAALVAVNVAGAAATIWYTYSTQRLYTSGVARDISALVAAQQLETALVMQKGFTTYYFLDGDPRWLKDLEEHHHTFKGGMKKAKESTHRGHGKKILEKIEEAYVRFSVDRGVVIELYKKGDKQAGAQKHWDVREEFYGIYRLCEEYKQLHEKSIAAAHESYRYKARVLNVFTSAAVPCVVVLGLLLGFVLYKQILEPVRQLAGQGAGDKPRSTGANEVKALGQRVHGLIEDVDHAQMELEQSREHLIQSEKLAMVGKLSAGVAHSVRNPLTSVKMRLFSLERGLDLDEMQKEDFDVISEEIRHLDTIIANFLEFSRPPRLRMQMISVSDVVDMALQLAKHRLESYDVEVVVRREQRLPLIAADPEQLKEFLMNLIINACESMGEGGKIQITEQVKEMAGMGPSVTVVFSDTGPGIPEGIANKIFDPFFSSKEEGTGLGLSIAMRIIKEHGGVLRIESISGMGASFFVALPVKEIKNWEISS